jgi:hypothetical protein
MRLGDELRDLARKVNADPEVEEYLKGIAEGARYWARLGERKMVYKGNIPPALLSRLEEEGIESINLEKVIYGGKLMDSYLIKW